MSKGTRCEGWRRAGGVMSLGPPTWHQCKSRGVALLTVKNDQGTQTLPACQVCWDACLKAKDHKVLKATPIVATRAKRKKVK